MKVLLLISAVLCTLALAAEEKNYFENPTFSTWGAKPEIPSRTTWRWLLPKGVKDGTVTITRSTAQKHTGDASLQIIDADKSASSCALGYVISPAELKIMANHILECSAWVKQINASKNRNVGIGVYLEYFDNDDKKLAQSDFRSIDETGETDWQKLSFRISIPARPKLLIFYFYCAKGYRETAEAYFNNISLTLKPME